MGIYLTDAELEVLDRAEGCLVKAYVFLRTRMDRRTGLVGSVTGISHQAVAEHSEYEIRKGAGVQVVRLGDTPLKAKEVARRICERLVGAGLLVAVGGPVLCFLCALADYGQVRSNQTGRERATPLSTDKATRTTIFNQANTTVCVDSISERATHCESVKVPNGPHIKDQGMYTPQSSSTTGSEVAPGDAGAGVNRDRAAPSQAGSLGRPGNSNEIPDRDRASPSHPAPGRRLSGGTDGVGALLDGPPPTYAGSSAAKELFADGISSPDAAEALLRAVLGARGFRVGVIDPLVSAWAEAGVTPDELAEAIEKARRARIKADSTQPIPLGYVAKVIGNQRKAARRAAERLDGDAPRAWRGGVGDLEALARQLGIAGARPGEELPAFRARVQLAYHTCGGIDDGQG